MTTSYASFLSGKAVALVVALFSLLCVTSATGVDNAARVTLFGFKDTEGDYVEFKSEEEGFVALYGNDEIVIPRVETFIMDGRRLTVSSAGDTVVGELAEATMLVQEGQEGVVTDVISLMSESAKNASLPTTLAESILDDARENQVRGRDGGEDVETQAEVDSDGNREAQPKATDTLQIDSGLSSSTRVDLFRDPYHSTLELSRFTFDANILHGGGSGAAEHWVVLFCYSWWSPCQAVMEPYSRLASAWQDTLNTALLTQKVRFARVDCATDRVLCNERDVEQFPHVQHYAQGSLVAKWSGGRESDATRLEKWLVKQLGTAPTMDIGDSGAESVTGNHDLFGIQGFFGIYADFKYKDRIVDALLIFTVVAVNVRIVAQNPSLWLQPPTSLEKRIGTVVRSA